MAVFWTWFQLFIFRQIVHDYLFEYFEIARGHCCSPCQKKMNFVDENFFVLP